jgi:flagellar basal-body rod protein FlgG
MGLSHQALYIATAGAYANQRKLEAITNNLANASTYGYKKKCGDYSKFST